MDSNTATIGVLQKMKTVVPGTIISIAVMDMPTISPLQSEFGQSEDFSYRICFKNIGSSIFKLFFFCLLLTYHNCGKNRFAPGIVADSPRQALRSLPRTMSEKPDGEAKRAGAPKKKTIL